MTIKIALLNTGDEIINGDILNSNAQQIAHQLFSNALQPGNHLSVNDEEKEIVSGIKYLLKHHQILIITGGLGPTSDDRTRFALARYLKRELIFNAAAWEHILKLHQKLGLEPVESNRQQALFPANSSVLINNNGSAWGCRVENNQQLIYMLPGPPHECLPMFNQLVLPELIQNYASDKLQLKWKLFGVSEGAIAEKLDDLLKDYPCQTGYRWDFPYIDFKLTIDKTYDATSLRQIVDQAVAPHIICPPNTTAVRVLQETLRKTKQTVVIDDKVTGGLLESHIKTPEFALQIIFSYEALPEAKFFKIQGLEHYWHQQTANTTELIIGTYAGDKKQLVTKTYTIPFRNNNIRNYAVEFIAYLIEQELAVRKDP